MIDIHLIIIIAIYSVFGIISIVGIIKNIKKNHSISIMSLCRIMYVAILVIIPIITYVAYLRGVSVSTLRYDSKYIWTFYIIALFTIIAYCFLNLGYKFKQPQHHAQGDIGKWGFIILISLLMILSIVSLFLWAKGFGGIHQLIQMANSIRAGFISSSSNTAFFKHFVPTAMIVSLLAFQYLFIAKKSISYLEKIYVFVLFVLSVFVSLIYILANDGRMLAGVYIALFFLAIIKNDYEIKNKRFSSIGFKVVFLSILAMILILNADPIFRAIRGEEMTSSVAATNDGLFSSLIQEFAFTLSSIQQALIAKTKGIAKLMIGNDLINGLFAWLPTSIKPVVLQDVWDYNTMLLNTGGYGQAPTTIVSQSVYDLGFIGIFVIPFIYGLIVKKVEKSLDADKNNLFANTLYLVLGFYLAKGLPYFSCYNIMMNVFFIVVAWFLYKVLQKLKV